MKVIAVSTLTMLWIAPSACFHQVAGPCEALEMWREPDEVFVRLAGPQAIGLAAESKRDLADSCFRRTQINAACPYLTPPAETSILSRDFEDLRTIAISSVMCGDSIRAIEAVKRWAGWWGSRYYSNPLEMRLDEDRFLDYVEQRIGGSIPDGPEITKFEQHLLLVYRGEIEWDPNFTMYTGEPTTSMTEQMSLDSDNTYVLSDDMSSLRLKAIAQERLSIISKFNICDMDFHNSSPLQTLFNIAITTLHCGRGADDIMHTDNWKLLWSLSHKAVPSDTRSSAEQLLAYVIDRVNGLYKATGLDLQTERRIAGIYEQSKSDHETDDK